jgi:DNA invertase Pin-like site-specific DNA recombinase
VRLSVDTDETTSPERQREKIGLWAKWGEHEVIGYSEDLDVSGAVSPFDRPKLGKWLARPDDWDALVVARFDRISRSVRDFSALVEWLKGEKKALVCLEPAIDLTTHAGVSFAQMLAVFAEFERNMIADRVRDAYRSIRENGKWAGGVVPFGYKAVRDDVKGWRLVPDPPTAAVVIEMVKRYLNGESFHMIARWLNDEKIPTSRDAQRNRNGRGKATKGWTPATVQKLLFSPNLKGQVMRAGEPLRDKDGLAVTITPLIPDSDYAELHEALEGRRYARRSNASKLLGIAACTICGAPLYISTTWHNGKAFPYYMCQTKRVSSCPTLRIRGDALEPLAFSQFLGAAGNAEVRKRVVIPAEDNGAELAKVDEAIAHLEAQYLAGKVYQGDKGAERFGLMMSKLEARRDVLAAQPSTPARVEYHGTGQTVRERWEELDDSRRRALMADSGYQLRALKDKSGLHVWFRIDADLAKRAAAAAEGHAGDVPLPENPAWRLGEMRKDGSFYWSHRVLITGDPAEKYGPGHDPSDEELAAMYSDQPHPPVKW